MIAELLFDSGRCIAVGEWFTVRAEVNERLFEALFPRVLDRTVYPQLYIAGGMMQARHFVLGSITTGCGGRRRVVEIRVCCVGPMPKWFRARLRQRLPPGERPVFQVL